MEATAKNLYTTESTHPGLTTIKTTLYDLIEAIDEEMDPGEEWMVATTVLQLLDTGHAKFLRDQFIRKNNTEHARS